MRTVYKNLIVNGALTDITTEDGRILSVEKTEEAGRDMGGGIARAGLFDVHMHGCLGGDTMDGREAIAVMTKALAKRGVTSFLPTTATMPFSALEQVSRTLPVHEAGCAKVRGLHLEGPFIAKSKKGAQNEAYVVPPTARLLDLCPNCTLITLAPEIEGAMDFIAEAKKRGVRMAIGHTEADYDTALSAIRAGANSLTHTFNAMPPFSHRAPGPIGAALVGGGYVQVIADGFHLHPSVVLALYKMFGPNRMILVSDMLSATGLSDGNYSLGGQTVVVKDGEARLTDGTIAGSTTFLDDCVRRAISFGIPADDAFKMASETPAKHMGLSCGMLAPGYDADFGVYDKDHRLLCTIIDGLLAE